MNEDTIARLKRRRGVVRTMVTKEIKRLETELKNEIISDTLEESVELLGEHAKELELLDSEIQKIIDSKDLEGDINSSLEYKEKIITWKFRARKKINALSNPKTSSIQNNSNLSSQNSSFEHIFQEKLQIKLPKLSIQKFYGDISQWLSFWNSFESAIHKNESLVK